MTKPQIKVFGCNWLDSSLTSLFLWSIHTELSLAVYRTFQSLSWRIISPIVASSVYSSHVWMYLFAARQILTNWRNMTHHFYVSFQHTLIPSLESRRGEFSNASWTLSINWFSFLLHRLVPNYAVHSLNVKHFCIFFFFHRINFLAH